MVGSGGWLVLSDTSTQMYLCGNVCYDFYTSEIEPNANMDEKDQGATYGIYVVICYFVSTHHTYALTYFFSATCFHCIFH